MLWIVQDNLYNEEGYVKLIDSLKRLDCEYKIVKPIPFTNIIVNKNFDSFNETVSEKHDPIKDDTQPIFVCGATSLNRIAKHRNWYPGTLLNDNFHYSKWKENWKNNLLNPLAEIDTIKGFINYTPDFDVFVRPTEDTKAISGTVMSKYDFFDWVMGINEIKDEGMLTPLNENTEIVISPIKEIYNECRLFIVDNKVVTASMYKIGNRVFGNSDVDERYIEFANKMTKIWSPAEGFVMDIADTPEGLKIIEINNLNSSGFYACDTDKIVFAIKELYEKV